MPVSRLTAEQLARSVADAYAEAERLLLRRIARNLAKGIAAPHWAEQKLAQLRVYRAETRALIADLQQQSRTGVTTTLTEAYRLGGLSAVRDLGAMGITAEPLAGLRAVELLTNEIVGEKLQAGFFRILRATDAVYVDAVHAAQEAALRDVTASGVEQVLLGTQTRLQATQSVLDRFLNRGLRVIPDKLGRSMKIDTYVEMAMRAGTMRAAVSGHIDTLQANGLDLVIVSEDGAPCPACADWEGQVLSSSGSDPNYPSLADATADGLFHVSCLHDVSLYQEGVTRPYDEKSAAEKDAESQRYVDNQALRRIERDIRQSKRMEAVAVDPAAQVKAKARIAKYQQRARDHVAATDAVRQYSREQIGKAH